MKILLTLHHLSSVLELIPNVDGFIIGHASYGTRLTQSFSVDEIKKLILLSKEHHKEIFLMANQMMTDDLLSDFTHWIQQFSIDDFTGIVCADLGVVKTLSDKGLSHKVIYNPETLITNVYDFNFLNRQHIQGVYVAKEITLSDILTIGQAKQMKLFMVGHGHLNMFYSKRQLMKNYSDYLDIPEEFHERQDLRIVEETRPGINYPIIEDQAGTHVFRAHVFATINHLNELDTVVDYLVIDTLFKDDKYGKKVSLGYNSRNKAMKETIENEYHETWDDGFFFKKTIYKGKTNES